MSLRARVWSAFILIVAIVVAGSSGFHFIEGWPWFDGLYMTLVTMTTVGYGETHSLSPAGRVFNIFLILAAVTAGGFLIAAVTQAMLQFELGHFLGRRRMQRELASLKNHYVICGAGRGGRPPTCHRAVLGVQTASPSSQEVSCGWFRNPGVFR